MSVTKPTSSAWKRCCTYCASLTRGLCVCTATTAGRDSTSGRAAVASRMKSRNCCWGAMTYSPTTAACFPATRRAGAWATGVTGPNVCEGGPVSDERPFDDLPRGHFGAILADPPWKFVTYSERGQGRSASRHYEVMTFEEIAALPVRDVAAPDAWLFLWVPGPHLPLRTPAHRALGLPVLGQGLRLGQAESLRCRLAHGHRHSRPERTPRIVCSGGAARPPVKAPCDVRS